MVPRWLIALPLIIPACFHPSYDHPRCGSNGECPSGLTCSAQQVCEPDGTPTDGLPTDAPSDDAPPDICIGRFVIVCRPPAPPNLALLASTTINTDTDPRCVLQDQGPGAPQLCVIVGNDIQVDAQVTAIGSHPLVLAAFHDLNITANGNLVLTSPRGETPGAGANDPACNAPTAGGMPGTYAGTGGGAGGSFGGAGGTGGLGGSGSSAGGTAGAPITSIVRVTGGCKGSPGGAYGSSPGGTPGNGGGAAVLLAANKLSLAGSVNAGGGGGDVQAMIVGGGGGGSGGFVGLDAMLYSITGHVTANGGGGAGGGGTTTLGTPGADGTSSTTIAAAGGLGPGGGTGAGGVGSIAAEPGARGQDGFTGGGGGGGGAGVILVKGAAPVSGSYSPPLTIVP